MGAARRPASPASRAAARLACPGSRTASSARKVGSTPDTPIRRRLACVQRRIGQPAARSVGWPLTCSVTVWRAVICRVYAPPRCAVCRGFPAGAMRFRPRGRGVSAPRPWRFRPPGCRAFPPQCRGVSLEWRGVSGGMPRRFRPTAGAGCRAFPVRPSSRARGAGRRPLPRRVIPFPDRP
jgi:hypothetical protein